MRNVLIARPLYLWVLREDIVHQSLVPRYEITTAAKAIVAVFRHRVHHFNLKVVNRQR